MYVFCSFYSDHQVDFLKMYGTSLTKMTRVLERTQPIDEVYKFYSNKVSIRLIVPQNDFIMVLSFLVLAF